MSLYVMFHSKKSEIITVVTNPFFSLCYYQAVLISLYISILWLVRGSHDLNQSSGPSTLLLCNSTCTPIHCLFDQPAVVNSRRPLPPPSPTNEHTSIELNKRAITNIPRTRELITLHIFFSEIYE